MSETIIETGFSADGTRRWELVRRNDGFFMYCEDSFVSDYIPELARAYEAWTPTHLSGLFETAQEAKADAFAQLPWLKQLKPER